MKTLGIIGNIEGSYFITSEDGTQRIAIKGEEIFVNETLEGVNHSTADGSLEILIDSFEEKVTLRGNDLKTINEDFLAQVLIENIEKDMTTLDNTIRDVKSNIANIQTDMQDIQKNHQNDEERQIELNHESLLALNESKQRLYSHYDDVKENSNNQTQIEDNSRTPLKTTIQSDNFLNIDTPADDREISNYMQNIPEDTTSYITEDTEDTPPPEDTPEDTAEDTEDTPPPEDTPEDTAEDTEDTPPPEDTPEDTAEDTEDTPPPEDTPEDTAEDTEDTPPPKDTPEDTAEDTEDTPEDTAEDTEDTPPPEDTPEDTAEDTEDTPPPTPTIRDDEFTLGSKDVPISNEYSFSGRLDTNDTLPTNEGYSYSIDAQNQPKNGVLSLLTSGKFKYEPDDYYTGTDSFVYIVADKNGNKYTATAYLNITSQAETEDTPSPEDTPVAHNDNYSLLNGATFSENVSGNDILSGGGSNTFTLTAGPFHGEIDFRADGTFTYAHNKDAPQGDDSFSYTITDADGDTASAKVSLDIAEDTPAAIKAVNDSFDIGSQKAPISNDYVLNAMLHTNDSLPEDGEYLYSIKTAPSHGTLTLSDDGEFKFEPEDYYDGTDSFTYIIKDTDGKTSTAVVHLTIDSVEPTDSTPIILDLNGDGVQTIALKDGVQFDIDADGDLDKTAWVSANDGLLVRDINNDGIINDASELFGEEMLKRDGTKAVDGYDALREYDTNNDGVVDRYDDDFDTIKIFKDSNSDGITDEGELISLGDAGVSQISTQTTQSDIQNNGNTIGLQSSYIDADGDARDAADVWFNFEENILDLELISSDISIVASQNTTLNLSDILSLEADNDYIDINIDDGELTLAIASHEDIQNNSSLEYNNSSYINNDLNLPEDEIQIIIDSY